jgi:hypothetical protein
MYSITPTKERATKVGYIPRSAEQLKVGVVWTGICEY